MAENPSDYDKLQDGRLDDLESLVTAEYQPPEGTEYSFPVANQGITQDQFRLMFLGQANGMIHGDNGIVNDSPDSTGWRYYLDRHDSDSETNQRNTLILRAGTSAESIVEGFYHRLTEDLELPFPPVTTTTVYHVTITYDPRDFKTNPVKIQVYPGTPPTSHGLVHVVLYKVERGPNQILTQATITRYRPYTAGLLSVQNRNQLPDPAQYPAGTLVVPSAEGHGLYVRQNGGHKWLDPISHKADKPGSWQSLSIYSSYGWQGQSWWRDELDGIRILANIRDGDSTTMLQLPPSRELARTYYGALYTSSGPQGFTVGGTGTTRNVLLQGSTTPGHVRLDAFISGYYF